MSADPEKFVLRSTLTSPFGRKRAYVTYVLLAAVLLPLYGFVRNPLVLLALLQRRRAAHELRLRIRRHLIVQAAQRAGANVGGRVAVDDACLEPVRCELVHGECSGE